MVPGVTRNLVVGSVGLCHLHLHELGDVESKGDGGDWDDVDQESLGVGHCHRDGSEMERLTQL